MEIAPTKCVIGNSLPAHAGVTVCITEIKPEKSFNSGIACKVFLPSGAKKRRATWLDIGHLIRVKEEARYVGFVGYHEQVLGGVVREEGSVHQETPFGAGSPDRG